eukprot:8727907-Alexandrium_andersonii.AAC.1
MPGPRAPIAKDCADCGLADRGLRSCDFALSRPSEPSKPCFLWRIRNLREQLHRMHPSGASRAKLEAAHRPRQFQVRTPEASLHFPKGGLLAEADCATGRPWAHCGLRFGPLAL